MDFYKKIVKNKEVSGVLSEKEYKCVSLQAITSEAVKENNKERLKDLVEEINGHLTDLRSIKDDKDPKNKQKCEKLIHQFEECLVKILNKKPSGSVLTILSQKLDELQHLSNRVIQENKNEELKKLAEKIQRDLEVVKEMPEVKSAGNTEIGKGFLQVVKGYEDLIKTINAHLSAKRRIISEPMLPQVLKKVTDGNSREQETTPLKANKIGLNEVEEKLKLMRQRRLNRLSTFVDQQSKLSEQRSRENSPKNSDNSNSNKSLENLSKISESVEIETAIKSIQSPEIVKPLPFREIAREKPAKTPEQKLFPKPDEKVITRPKVQKSEFQMGNAGVAVSFKNTEPLAVVSEKHLASNVMVAGTTLAKEWPKPDDKKFGKEHPEENIKAHNINTPGKLGSMADNKVSTSVRSSFGKGSLTRSFAERQIENAKMQAALEKPKVNLKQSNSTKTTPPRTPTQIRKIFNSFNSCVMGSNDSKSIEDLPKEFNSPFEQELETVQLKSTSLNYRSDQSRQVKDYNPKGNIQEVPKTELMKPVDTPPAITRKTKYSERKNVELENVSSFSNNSLDQSRGIKDDKSITNSQEVLKTESLKFVDTPPAIPQRTKSLESRNLQLENFSSFNKSLHQGQSQKTRSEYYDVDIKRSNENLSHKTSNNKRLSLDFDAVVVRGHESNYVEQQATDLLITVKRDSNTIPNEPDRYSFSTFRTSSDSLKNENINSVENPLYGVIKADTKLKDEEMESTNNDTIKCSTHEKVLKDFFANCSSLEELLKNVNRKKLRNIDNANKIKEINVLLKDVKKNVETTLDINENRKENKKFARFVEDICNIENTISLFKGLKRDSEYLLIDTQLAKYYVEIDQIRPQSPNNKNEKKYLTERLKRANKNLEDKVTRNEEILKSVLEEQVQMLGKKYTVA